MTPQERELILGVAQRLRTANLTQKDNEAERLILSEIGAQKDALYLLTQAVIVQEQGLRHATERIQQLEANSQQGHGGFLSNLFGGGSPAPAPAPPPPAYSSPPPAGGGSGVGTFLGTAAAAAAGAVGGQLIYDGMRHLFDGPSLSGHQPGGGFLDSGPPNPAGGGSWGVPQDVGSSGGGGDFAGTETSDTDSESGGDFGGDAQDDDDSQGGDFGNTDPDDDDSQGGGGDF
jgi:hypothetical protein